MTKWASAIRFRSPSENCSLDCDRNLIRNDAQRNTLSSVWKTGAPRSCDDFSHLTAKTEPYGTTWKSSLPNRTVIADGRSPVVSEKKLSNGFIDLCC